jgi:hypothetical protein
MAIFGAAAAGCGGNDRSGIVAGCVTLDGNPLTHASLVFENAELAVARMAPIDDAGRYTVRLSDGKGLPPGHYAVWIVPGVPLSSGSPSPIELLGGLGEKASPDNGSIPKRYRSASTSGLTADVTSGESRTFDFAIGSDPTQSR